MTAEQLVALAAVVQAQAGLAKTLENIIRALQQLDGRVQVLEAMQR